MASLEEVRAVLGKGYALTNSGVAVIRQHVAVGDRVVIIHDRGVRYGIKATSRVRARR